MTRRRLLVGTVAVTTILGVTAGWLAANVWTTDTALDEPEFRTDRDLVSQTFERLAVVEQHLRELPMPTGATDRSVTRYPCTTDSGDLFQPRVSRLWRVRPADAERVVRDLAASLRQQGWTVPETPNRFGTYEVSMDEGEGGWRAVGVLSASFEKTEAYVEVYIEGARPCELVSD